MAKYKLIFKVGLCQAGTNVGELLKDISTGRTGLCPEENSRSKAGEGMKVSLAA